MEGHDKKKKVATTEDHVQTEQIMGKNIRVQTKKTKGKNVRVQTEQTVITLDDEETNDRRHVVSRDVEIKSSSPKEFEMVCLNLNGEETLEQRQVVETVKDSHKALDDSMKKNRRVVEAVTEERNLITTNMINDIKADLGPIVEYAKEPVLPLVKACTPLVNIIHNLSFYVQLALEETPEEPPNGLTIDESAAIRLYTIEWDGPHRSLYSMLNYTLKTADREGLRPYFKYLKLFLTALVKLPCVPPLTVWRGVTKNLSAEFPPGTPVTWWAFSSCTTALTVLENNMYLGNTGDRTLFSVEAINSRTVRAHSHFVTEDEILLLPGTCMEVQSQFCPASNLHIIHLKQIKPVETLLEPPFPGALLYPPNKKKVPWYKEKRTICELNLFIILCIASIIIGSVLGTRRPPPPPICKPRKFPIRADLLWSFDCGDSREDLTGLYNGTNKNGASYSSPDFSGQGKALVLNSILSQSVLLPRSLNLTVNTSFTVSAWLFLTGYKTHTILTDCNTFNSICIQFVMNSNFIYIYILSSEDRHVTESTLAPLDGLLCESCWMYMSFSFNNQTKVASSYFNGLWIGGGELTMSDPKSTGRNASQMSYIGINALNGLEPFSGLIDQLSISYYVKNASEMLNEATLLYYYKFDAVDINADSGPNNISALSQNVYRSSSNNESSLLLNSSDSYFQSSGFTLLKSKLCEFSLAFWFRLFMMGPNYENVYPPIFIPLLQLTSNDAEASLQSYTCIFTVDISATNGYIIRVNFPNLFTSINTEYRVVNNTWVYFGLTYSKGNTFYSYVDGQGVDRHVDSRYSSLLLCGNPRLYMTMGSAFLNDTSKIQPEIYESMRCFAESTMETPIQMYGEIEDFKFFARALDQSEFAALYNDSKDKFVNM